MKALKIVKRSSDSITDPLSKLAHVRDLLTEIAEGRGLGMGEQDDAWFVCAGFVEAAAELERALVDSGVIEDQGIFTEREIVNVEKSRRGA
jgi:hypothetical protein